MNILNMGIVAHVDAGKTSLTERLLFDAGVIDHVGSVDSGDTQTDSMDLERRRGITIKSAVVSFTVDDLRINLIDTPGHPEFISEVERALRVLDGAVLVVSAVEGVQAQTRILMRTLSRLRVPTLLFVNKVDRMGATYDELLDNIGRKLTPAAIPMNRVEGIGTRVASTVPYDLSTDERHFVRVAEALADNDDRFLSAYLSDTGVDVETCERALVAQTGRALAHPVYFGSARTGVGVTEIVAGIRRLLPATAEAELGAEQPLRGTVFKIDRGASGEKVAYVRLAAGSVSARQQVAFYRPTRTAEFAELGGKVTEIRVFDNGAASTQTARVTAGNIAKLWGLKEIRIGDQLGEVYQPTSAAYFSPPTLETLVRPRDPADAMALYTALQTLTEQDPLIDTRRDEEQQEISVRLYGEVQKEVLESQLTTEFGLGVSFEETRTIYVERLIGVGEAIAEIGKHGNEYPVAVGLRIEPAAAGSGVRYRVASEQGSLLRAFHTAVEESVYERLREGPYGWEIIDCTVTLTRSGYTTGTIPWHFRTLTPALLTRAIQQAGTRVCEPVERFEVGVPSDTVGGVLAKLVELGATPNDPTIVRESAYLEGVVASEKVHELERRLPGLSHGEGVLLTEFDGYRPVEGVPPRRPTAPRHGGEST